MEQELNIAAILRDKPHDLKLYDVARDINVFYGCLVGDDCEIHCDLDEGGFLPYNYNGTLIGFPNGMQILKPSKDMQDWTKFAWKKGDVLRCKNGDMCIFEKFIGDDYTSFIGWFLSKKYECSPDPMNTKSWIKEDDDQAVVQYINTIELHNNGKLNLKTLKIEKSEPQFKDWDIVVLDESISECTAKCILILKLAHKVNGNIEFYALLNVFNYNVFFDENFKTNVTPRPATGSEKQQLFAAIAKKNKRWNAKTKQIEDIPIPKRQIWNHSKKDELKTLDYFLAKEKGDSDALWNLYQYAYKYENCIITVNSGYIGRKSFNIIPYNDQTKHLLGTTDDYKE